MGSVARWIQALGVLAFLASAFAVVEEPCQHPRLVAASHALARALTALHPEGCAEVPADELRADLARGWSRGGLLDGLWTARRWYPYLLAPLWLAALVVGAVASPDARARRLAGAVLLAAAAAVAVFEAFYLGFEYEPLVPWLGRVEVLLAWLAVVGVLFLRRRDDRGVGALEAHVAAQALLSALHLLTLPTSQARVWLQSHALADVCAALLANFRPPFWIALGGLALAAGAVYLRRMPATAPVAAGPAAELTVARTP